MASNERTTITINAAEVDAANAWLASLDPALADTFTAERLTVSGMLDEEYVPAILAHFANAAVGEEGRLQAIEALAASAGETP